MATAVAQIPPGFEVIQVTQTADMDHPPQINNHRQIVFARWFESQEVTGEIFLYDGNTGELTQLTNDLRDLGYHVRDDHPHINDDGVIVWSRYMGPDGRYGPTAEIMIRTPDGTVTRFTDNATDDWADGINSSGHLVWFRQMGPGCRGGVYDVFFYDGHTVQQITDDAIRDGKANEVAAVNDLDEIVWTKFDFCVDPWESWIMLWRNGQTLRLTDGQFQPNSPDINNLEQVAWFDRSTEFNAIQLWENGVARELTDWGTGPELNERGDVDFIRWHNDTQTWQQWYYRDGRFWQLSDDPFWNTNGSINDAGEVAWRSGPTFSSDIRFMRRFDLGDLNCDRQVNALDINAFILAMFDQAEYGRQHPACDPLLGDFNDDGLVNASDIEPFIDRLFQ